MIKYLLYFFCRPQRPVRAKHIQLHASADYL